MACRQYQHQSKKANNGWRHGDGGGGGGGENSAASAWTRKIIS
jgi:hypothetical protein